MTPDDLARIEARADLARLPYMTGDTIGALGTLLSSDVPALIAALREAWAERDALIRKVDDEAYRKGLVMARALDAEAALARVEALFGPGAPDHLRAVSGDARAALARVTALCDRQEEYAESIAPEYVSSAHVPVSAIRAAITGPTPTEGDDRA